MSILKFTEDVTNCKMKFDNGQRVDGEYGVQYKWSCNEDDVFFATEQFNALLRATDVKAGDVLSIKKRKKEDIQGKVFMVFEVNGKTLDDFNAMPKPTASVETKPLTPSPAEESVIEDLERRVKALENIVGKPSVETSDIPF